MNTLPKSMQELWQESYLAADNEAYFDNLYEQYLADPSSIAPEWRQYFDQLAQFLRPGQRDLSHKAIQQEFLNLAKQARSRALLTAPTVKTEVKANEKVIELINAYREHGHLHANIDPLGLNQSVKNPMLDLDYYGFSEKDMNEEFEVGDFKTLGKTTATLAEIYSALRRIYCGDIGFEYMYIDRIDEVEWLRKRIEEDWARFNPTKEEKRYLLQRLVVADGLEKYLGFKYVGQKRFSLEGGDALIPMLDTMINRSAASNAKEVVLGMSHRGRLNVLVNIVGKNPKEIFATFEGNRVKDPLYSGDVKYHLGCSSNLNTPSGVLHVALAFNPSHLEIVTPVVQGSVRARQRRRRDTEQHQVIPVQIHGDAAFSSQGVVMETFSMSQARWFKVGGSIHIVVNNQIGFTISDIKDSRSSLYCTDPAKMVSAPIVHVNANDVEAVYFAAQLAIDYRQTFKRDVAIDLVCYRRHGHNEADEPSATQPIMYKIIKAMPVPYQIYAKKLITEGMVTEDEVKKMVSDYRQSLDDGKIVVDLSDKPYEYSVDWEPYIHTPWTKEVKTSVPKEHLIELGQAITKLPDGFVLQAQVKKSLDAWKKMIDGEAPLNWGYAENLAYATLLIEGYPIRLCGQDSARGTFAHRHGVLHDQNTNKCYIPLSHLAPNQAQINLVDSLLSEEGVLAFEYGYSTAEPKFLDIWEAQYGDFANGAQIVIDQFISSGEQKWGRLCGLVMYLPHGYEGGGPEHSSARLERYLQLCAQDNMQVCIPTNPAQIFHLLRRQMLRPYRKPLITMTPKSLLRNPLASSPLEDLVRGQFEVIIPEVDKLETKQIKTVIFCSGKVYYELLQKRREMRISDIAIIRIEQLYPFPEQRCREILADYAQVKDIVWCQEEPQNQGAWMMMQMYLLSLLRKGQILRYAGRKASASPATGYHSIHVQEQKDLVLQAFDKQNATKEKSDGDRS